MIIVELKDEKSRLLLRSTTCRKPSKSIGLSGLDNGGYYGYLVLKLN